MKYSFGGTVQLVREQIMLLLTSQQWNSKVVKQNEANCVLLAMCWDVNLVTCVYCKNEVVGS